MIRLENRLNSIEEICTISHNQDVNTDLILMLCGRRLGEGTYRTVYEYNLQPEKYVVKTENNSTNSNIAEYIIWDEVQGLTNELAWVKEWFAPIKYCSPNGKIIIMERTRECPDKKRPDKVPEFFMDVKYNNFGWIGNKFVCHDYGFIFRFLKYEKKFQKAVW